MEARIKVAIFTLTWTILSGGLWEENISGRFAFGKKVGYFSGREGREGGTFDSVFEKSRKREHH